MRVCLCRIAVKQFVFRARSRSHSRFSRDFQFLSCRDGSPQVARLVFRLGTLGGAGKVTNITRTGCLTIQMISRQFYYVKKVTKFSFKAAVRSFSSLSPSLFEICNCSYSWNYQLYVGCASARHSADESNVLRRVCGCQSPRRCDPGIHNHRFIFLEV